MVIDLYICVIALSFRMGVVLHHAMAIADDLHRPHRQQLGHTCVCVRGPICTSTKVQIEMKGEGPTRELGFFYRVLL